MRLFHSHLNSICLFYRFLEMNGRPKNKFQIVALSEKVVNTKIVSNTLYAIREKRKQRGNGEQRRGQISVSLVLASMSGDRFSQKT